MIEDNETNTIVRDIKEILKILNYEGTITLYDPEILEKLHKECADPIEWYVAS